ncbi:hypothetical protein AB4072_10335 [Microvirga sp. 2MCAF38]|uniref:hypothetical protein n=1 Tax=Microvirga sp. 2MCAF38 TaxID=3232989 RepID=UPI003F98C49B
MFSSAAPARTSLYFKKLGSKGSESKPALLKKNFFIIGPEAKDANDYIIYDNKKGILYYDADGSGSGAAVQIATLPKKLKMTYRIFTSSKRQAFFNRSRAGTAQGFLSLLIGIVQCAPLDLSQQLPAASRLSAVKPRNPTSRANSSPVRREHWKSNWNRKP